MRASPWRNDFVKAMRAQRRGMPLYALSVMGVAATLRALGEDASSRATWGIKRHDLGGFEVNFTEPGRNASRFVALTMVGRDGRVIQ